MEFNKMYQKVKYIVRKCEKEYYIQLWEKDDWEQEGQLTLFELYQKNPEIGTNEELLYKYFKTKFRNRKFITICLFVFENTLNIRMKSNSHISPVSRSQWNMRQTINNTNISHQYSFMIRK